MCSRCLLRILERPAAAAHLAPHPLVDRAARKTSANILMAAAAGTSNWQN